MEALSIFAGLLAAILVAISKGKWKELSLIQKITMMVVILSSIFGSFVSGKKAIKENLLEKIEASYGTIEDLHGATLPLIGIGFRLERILPAQLGGVFRAAGHECFKAYIKNDQLFVNTIIKDSLANPIIAIYENEWTKYQDTYEFNNDETAIELVTKGDRTVFFHLELKKGVVFVEGTIYVAPFSGINLFDTGTASMYSSGYYTFGKGDVLDNSKMKRLFKYPREMHLGERENNL